MVSPLFKRSCIPHIVVTTASINVSGIGSPWTVTISVEICIPTFRTSRSDRLLIFPWFPLANVIAVSGVNFRVTVSVPFAKLVSRVPFIRPSQLLYAKTLSSASTVATESSQSIIVLTADSTITSAMFAGSAEPISCSGSITISICRLFFARKIELGLSASPTCPTN